MRSLCVIKCNQDYNSNYSPTKLLNERKMREKQYLQLWDQAIIELRIIKSVFFLKF